MITLNHYILFASDGFTCTCGHIESVGVEGSDVAKRKAAALHQFAVFLHEADDHDQIGTSCLSCGQRVRVPVEGSDRLALYNDWIHTACLKCLQAPVSVVAP